MFNNAVVLLAVVVILLDATAEKGYGHGEEGFGDGVDGVAGAVINDKLRAEPEEAHYLLSRGFWARVYDGLGFPWLEGVRIHACIVGEGKRAGVRTVALLYTFGGLCHVCQSRSLQRAERPFGRCVSLTIVSRRSACRWCRAILAPSESLRKKQLYPKGLGASEGKAVA